MYVHYRLNFDFFLRIELFVRLCYPLCMLPSFLTKYFWDTDATKLDMKKNEPYIIERILEYGDERAIHWMNQSIDKRRILHMLEQSRALSPKSAFFWAAALGVPKRRITCLRTPSRERRLKHWIW